MRATESSVRLAKVRERVDRACHVADRDPAGVRIVAVSKGRSIDEILELYELGLRDFGENRLHELEQKVEALALVDDLQWHFVGNLQTRQLRQLAPLVDVYHSIWRRKTVAELESTLASRSDEARPVSCFLQVNVSNEPQKGGIVSSGGSSDDAALQELSQIARSMTEKQDALVPVGLMTIASQHMTDADNREAFESLASLSRRLRLELSLPIGGSLSMGMSGDFEQAVEAGATHIRLGSILFS